MFGPVTCGSNGGGGAGSATGRATGAGAAPGTTTLGGGGGNLTGSPDVAEAFSFTMQAPFTGSIAYKTSRL
jgi:hypothetical protein